MPEYGELCSIFGTEYFSLVCSATLKKSILFHGINKRGSREDEKKKNIWTKIKVYNHEKYSKVQIATSTFWESSLSPQLSVINVSVEP